jgi:hypothetical protein
MYFETGKMIFKITLETPGISLPNYVLEKIHNEEENTMGQFLNHHKDTIYGVISGFDRVLFRGTLRSISYVDGMRAFLSSQNILLKDFGDFVLKKSNQIKECAEAFAHHHERPFQYVAFPSKSKEEIARAIMQRDGITDGLICVLYCVEPCQSYENSIKMYDKQGCVLSIETTINNRRYRALRPIASDEARLFQSVLHGQFLLHGFRNEHIRTLLFPSHKTEEEKHRNVARTSRLISLLRAHGLIKKVPKTRLYRITQKGYLVMSTSLIFRTTSISLLQKAA